MLSAWEQYNKLVTQRLEGEWNGGIELRACLCNSYGNGDQCIIVGRYKGELNNAKE
jgi:hypothetical protein